MNEHPTRIATEYSFGPRLTGNGIEFRLWAPAAKRVELITERASKMSSREDGWFRLEIESGRVGAPYRFRIDGDYEVPDPASHFQPDDVFGPSEVIDHAAYPWRTTDWRGRPWEETVVLELHIGAFTAGGTFRSAIDRLDDVAGTGITAIELMPVADFAGRWNWGYDGVLLYAPDSSYGRPEDLKALIDAAHARGLMVFLDVVYNHLGPEGNFLPRYAPQFFCKAQTPWGSAIDYRIPEVRAFAVENALHWLEHYRFDGLRLDAVHAIIEPGSPPLLHELSRAVSALAARSGRHIHLVLENDDNESGLLAPAREMSAGLYRAQWNDDYHHAWHVVLTNETGGYYKDYTPDPLRHLQRAMESGFDYQGEPSRHREGSKRGQPSRHLSPTSFVNFLQNHDQIGNRPLGDRLTSLAGEDALAAATAVTLLAPMTPLLFMGEEWGSTRPFPFFCDFKGELAEAVRRGRRAEFRDAYAEYGDEIPDPLAETTFLSAQLDWESPERNGGSARLVRELLRIRQQEIVPGLAGASFGECQVNGRLLQANWPLGDGRLLQLLANLGDEPVKRPAVARWGQPIFGGDLPAELQPWSVFWSLGE